MNNWRIAVVVQRYGEEVSGGAELHARWLAEHLTEMAEVHAITTCARDYITWVNYYPPGESILNGVHVHRFIVDRPRRWRKFQRLTKQLFLDESPSVIKQLDWMQQQGPVSTALFNHIEKVYQDFDAFIFFTYLYATTYFGLPLVANKTILVPTAHDDPFIYLPIFRPFFQLPHTIAYNTATEQKFVNRVTENGRGQLEHVVGIGINLPPEASAARFRQKYGIEGDFLLYVGRIDESKNISELLPYFGRYDNEERDISLVLIGKSNIKLPDHPRLHHLGFLPEQDKFDALAAATVVVNPSIYESFSMIALEAWLMKKPVLVNGNCDVLKDQCRASNGGLYYRTYEEFAEALNVLLDRPSLRAHFGECGYRFARSRYDWPIVIEKYRQMLTTLCEDTPEQMRMQKRLRLV